MPGRTVSPGHMLFSRLRLVSRVDLRLLAVETACVRHGCGSGRSPLGGARPAPAALPPLPEQLGSLRAKLRTDAHGFPVAVVAARLRQIEELVQEVREALPAGPCEARAAST